MHYNLIIKIFKYFPVLIIFFLCFILGCNGSIKTISKPSFVQTKDVLPVMGYAIQIGAFSRVENAVKLTELLQLKGLDAYYFNDSNLYKVRFGNFISLKAAHDLAEELRIKGLINEYIIVKPDDYKWIKNRETINDIRDNIVSSAKQFLGVPYSWGGVSDKTGFDCSGLAMAVYKLNGFNLPRTTVDQWSSGIPVDEGHLAPGDLVFFSTKKGSEVSHVGIYIGKNCFIHAPGKGKNIKIESLLTEYYINHFIGACTYLK
jgi:hypothetical protein